ncbi:60S ribosomal protein L14-2 [Durusdinium trenchii]|uniref:60S ribosomal protein L14-2 n=1 Tax=Durusdinium trenchii TaxID=1381693 RepID=A0ABP0PJ28_9DINO
MVFNKFVEVGRVVLINYGPEKGKLATVINIVDGNRVLVDGPYTETGVRRQVINLKRVTLTDITLNVGLQSTEKKLKAAFKAEDVASKFAESALAKKLALQKKRASMTDFDRFKVMLAKKEKAKAIKKKLAQLK